MRWQLVLIGLSAACGAAQQPPAHAEREALRPSEPEAALGLGCTAITQADVRARMNVLRYRRVAQGDAELRGIALDQLEEEAVLARDTRYRELADSAGAEIDRELASTNLADPALETAGVTAEQYSNWLRARALRDRFREEFRGQRVVAGELERWPWPTDDEVMREWRARVAPAAPPAGGSPTRDELEHIAWELVQPVIEARYSGWLERSRARLRAAAARMVEGRCVETLQPAEYCEHQHMPRDCVEAATPPRATP